LSNISAEFSADILLDCAQPPPTPQRWSPMDQAAPQRYRMLTFLWVLSKSFPFFWHRAVLWIPVSRSGSNWASNYKGPDYQVAERLLNGYPRCYPAVRVLQLFLNRFLVCCLMSRHANDSIFGWNFLILKYLMTNFHRIALSFSATIRQEFKHISWNSVQRTGFLEDQPCLVISIYISSFFIVVTSVMGGK